MVAGGGAGFKAVRSEYGSGKTFFAHWLQELAKRADFATAEVQFSEAETPLHRMETVHRRAMERLSTADAFQGAFCPVVDGWFYGLEEEILAEGRVVPAEATALAAATEALMEKRLSAISRVTLQFALAPRGYHRARVEGDAATAEGLIAWLAGQPHVGAAAKRPAGIKGEVDHFAALSFLLGVADGPARLGLRRAGPGARRDRDVAARPGGRPQKGLNALRQLFDEIDAGRYPGLYLVITGTPAFYDGPQGVRRLELLAQRLHVDFQTDALFDNPRAKQLRLPGFSHERLVEVGLKVRDLYAQDARDRNRLVGLVDDAYVAEPARAVTGDLGGRVGVAPRLFLR